MTAFENFGLEEGEHSPSAEDGVCRPLIGFWKVHHCIFPFTAGITVATLINDEKCTCMCCDFSPLKHDQYTIVLFLARSPFFATHCHLDFLF